MSVSFNVETRGLKGATMIPQEFLANIEKVLQKPVDEYAADVANNIQADAPVLTGYLRNNVRSWRENPTTAHTTSWAPYSGPAEIRSHRPHFFENNALTSANIGGQMILTASEQYLKILINKYQNQP